ncbi:MAG TPA: hypothetical protein VGU68_18135 [Ktedonobacteraceae bacterium]|nr:hypothetical protein [Ktedonobacteraceae bacterium]
MVTSIDGNAVLERVYQRQAPPTWAVFPAKRSFFVKNIIVFLVFAILCVGGLIYLKQSNTVLVPIGTEDDSLSASDFNLYSTVETIAGGIMILVFIGAAVDAGIGLLSCERQFLIVMPEGIVMRKSRGTTSIAYAQLQQPIQQMKTRYASSLIFKGRGIGKKGTLGIPLDTHFGNPKDIARSILNGHQAYLAFQHQMSMSAPPAYSQTPPYAPGIQQPSPQAGLNIPPSNVSQQPPEWR